MAFRGIQSTNIISTEVGFTDPVLILNKDGSTSVDVGFLGKIGSTSYAGLVKDSTTEDFLLIKSISINSSSVNDIDATDLSLVKGNLQVDTVTGDLVGDVTGQVSSISNFNTDSLSEGSTNLYYTTTRADADFDTRIATKNTDNLSEGSTNLYYTDARADARVNLQVGTNLDLSGRSTSNLPEGTNLYYTNARADARAQLKIDALVDSSPGTLDTLNELAAALGDDANFSTTVTNSIAAKLPLAGGTLTGDLSVSANVYLTAGVDARIQLGTSGSGANSDSDNSVYVRGNDDHLILGAAGNGSISLKENADTRMYIATGGNTGIGTTSPGAKLSVSGPAALANLGGGSTGSAALYVNSTSGHVGELIQVLKNGTTKMHMANDGKLGLGTSSPTEVLHVVGSILATGDITAYSDDSLKTNVQVIDNAVSKVEQLRGVTFDRIEDGSTSTGVIAQELKEVLPEAVHTNEQGLHSVAYGNVVGLLIEAIKQQQKQIDTLIKNNQSNS